MMKKLTLILVSIILVFSACTKRFPDGPTVSFRSIGKRIAGDWELENYIVDGTDSASIINNILGAKCTMQFDHYHHENTSFGDYLFQWGADTSNYFLSSGLYGVRGTNYIDLMIKPNVYKRPANLFIALGDTSTPPLHVLKCEYKTLWLAFQLHNRSYELHLSSINKDE